VNLPFYTVSRMLCRLLVRAIYGFEAIRPENVPATGPVIVACNHVSYLDPVVLGIGFRRPVTYLAKEAALRDPRPRAGHHGLGVYPLDREAGGVAAVRAALRALKDGRCVGIFPEGTRNLTGDVEGKGGAALLALSRVHRSCRRRSRVPAARGRSTASGSSTGEPIRVERKRKADGAIWRSGRLRSCVAFGRSRSRSVKNRRANVLNRQGG